MNISNIRRLDGRPSERGFRSLAIFDVELFESVTVYRVMAVSAPDGRIVIYGPRQHDDGRAASFAPHIRAAIAEEIRNSLGIDRHDESTSAA